MPAGPAPHSSAAQSNITRARSMLCGRFAPSASTLPTPPPPPPPAPRSPDAHPPLPLPAETQAPARPRPTPPAQTPRTPQRTPPVTARPGPAYSAAPAAARARTAPYSPAPNSMRRKVKNAGRRSEGGRGGGWGLRLVAVTSRGAADRPIGPASARAAAPGPLAGLPLSASGPESSTVCVHPAN